ncbi:MAG TPA: ABC transporter permease [Ktedonobacteraceae bacterium]|jgi:ABC-2 type transport system permease protein
MNVQRILALAGRILRQVIHDRRTLTLIFLVPLLVMTLLYLVLNGATSPPTLAIPADRVDSPLNNGEADAALIFPPDFVRAVANAGHPVLHIELEGSNPAIAGALQAQIQGLVRQINFTLAHSQQSAPTLLPVAGGALTLASPRYLHGGPQYTTTDELAPIFIGLFSFFFVFLLTSIAFLRERSQGTIERVMVSPLTRAELVIGYVCGFTLFALLQSLIILLFVVFVLHVHYNGNLALVFLVSALLTIGSVNLGIFLSTFAHNELQVLQFIPLVFGVQVFLSGVFWPLAQLPAILHPISYLLPLTYANDALRAVMLKRADLSTIGPDLAALLAFALLMIGLSSLTTRRQLA